MLLRVVDLAQIQQMPLHHAPTANALDHDFTDGWGSRLRINYPMSELGPDCVKRTFSDMILL